MELFGGGSNKRKRKAIDHDEISAFRKRLPVYEYREELVRHMTKSPNVLLVTAATGTGKSTQIPAYLLDEPHKICVTQPRRVAAMTLAQRVAAEHRAQLGQQVGYRIRFDDRTTVNTQLVYATDGMLLREAMVDPLLKRYTVVFLDESHERSLATDILLGVVKRAREARRHGVQPLRVVIMSATLQTDIFIDFFGTDDITHVDIPGRQYPVQVLYTAEPADDYVEAALSTILQIHEHHREPDGDILVFLPGQEEIEDLALLLKLYLQKDEAGSSQWTGDRVEAMTQTSKHDYVASNQIVSGVMICLLYAALPADAQLAAFADKPPGCARKVILATTIAETSVTVPAIRYIVDTGLHKVRQCSATTGMETLMLQPTSQAQALQRAGRAGRISDGLCFRLYTEDEYDKLLPDSLPEIARTSLTQVVLQLKGMGIDDVEKFDFVTPPDAAGLARALRLLLALQALDENAHLTAYGRSLAGLPLDPTFGHLLLQSQQYGCTRDMLTAVAVLSAENVFYRPTGGTAATKAAAAHKRFGSHEGDLPTFLNVYRAWRQEAVYVRGSRKRRRRKPMEQAPANKMVHDEWCRAHYVSHRALERAFDIREQLELLCRLPNEQYERGMNTDIHHDDDQEARIAFLKCAAAGLFLQAASRVQENSVDHRSKGQSGVVTSTRGRYRTKIGKQEVSIHPASTLFGRQPAAACVVYTELVTTKRTYIRGVTQIREEWLHEIAPSLYPN